MFDCCDSWLRDLYTFIGFYVIAAYCIIVEFYVDRIRRYDGLSRLEYLHRAIKRSKFVCSAGGGRKLIALVTGANGTIGTEITYLLLQNNFKVIGLVPDRDNNNGYWMTSNGQPISHPELLLHRLDLANLPEVSKLAKLLSGQFPRIDLIICNAGVMLHPFRLTPNGFEMHFAVNLLSHAVLVNRFLAFETEKSAGGENFGTGKPTGKSRVVLVSSATAHLGDFYHNPEPFSSYRNGYQAYATSKLAVSLYAQELQNAILRKGKESAVPRAVTIISAHPGCVAGGLYKCVNFWTKTIIFKLLRPLMRDPAMAAAEIVALGCADGLEGGCYYQHMVPTRILCTVTAKQQQRLYQRIQNIVAQKCAISF